MLKPPNGNVTIIDKYSQPLVMPRLPPRRSFCSSITRNLIFMRSEGLARTPKKSAGPGGPLNVSHAFGGHLCLAENGRSVISVLRQV